MDIYYEVLKKYEENMTKIDRYKLNKYQLSEHL